MDNVDILAYNLKRLRKEKGFTQDEIANKIGEKRTTYASYEKNVTPPEDVLRKVAKLLKVELLEFYKDIPIDLVMAQKTTLPKTVGGAMDMQHETIQALKGQIAVMEKYIAKLEGDLANK